MNPAAQAAGQLADDREPSTAPDGLRCRPIVRNLALYDVTRKRQLHSQFRVSTVKFCMSCDVGQQLGYNQPNLPATLSFEPQIIRRKQDAYRQVIQLVLRDGEAKPLEVRCGISEALLIWHVERPMNIGAVMQEVDDAEERSLDCHVIRPHRLG